MVFRSRFLPSWRAILRLGWPARCSIGTAVSGHADTLKVLGLDPFRAATLQPALMAEVGADLSRCFRPDAIFFEYQRRGRPAGGAWRAFRGHGCSRSKSLRVVGILSQGGLQPGAGVDGISPSAQWLLTGSANSSDRPAVLPGTDVERFRSEAFTHIASGRTGHCATGGARPAPCPPPAPTASPEHAGVGVAVDGRFSWFFPRNRWLSCAAAARSRYCALWD